MILDLPVALASNTHALRWIRGAIEFRAQSARTQTENRPGDRFGLRLSWVNLRDTRRRQWAGLLSLLGQADGNTGVRHRLRIGIVAHLGLSQAAAGNAQLMVASGGDSGSYAITCRSTGDLGLEVGDFLTVGGQLVNVATVATSGPVGGFYSYAMGIWPNLFSVKAAGTLVEYTAPTGLFELELKPSEMTGEPATGDTLAAQASEFNQVVE